MGYYSARSVLPAIQAQAEFELLFLVGCLVQREVAKPLAFEAIRNLEEALQLLRLLRRVQFNAVVLGRSFEHLELVLAEFEHDGVS